MKAITFPFRVPKTYHRAFMLEGNGFRYFIEVEGNKIHSGLVGVLSNGERGKLLDWIAESIESVRSEVGK